MSIRAAEVPYVAEDLNVLKPVLITFVERQVGKWPGSFRPSRATVSDIRKVLLDPQHGFTKPCTTESPKRATSPLSPTPEPPSKDIEEHTARNHFIEFITSKWVKLLIEDARALPKPTKISQEVNLWIVDTKFCKLDEWRVELLDLIQELQKSHAAPKGFFNSRSSPRQWADLRLGSFRLAIRDHEYPEHRIYFAKILDSGPPDEGRIEPWDPTVKPLEVARQRAKTTKSRSSKTAVDHTADVEWLTEEFKTLPGYSEFNENLHKVQQNAGVVASWRFVGMVSEAYHRHLSHIPYDAENAVRILKLYEDNQTVVDRIASEQDKPEGAKGLLAFLVDWEKTHKSV
ncbi:hypothetical protein DFH06DRAFT_1135328 [Mycena polygramma]|nr:hypothetical protein DFH06DRAFT_1421536 [Mycena polygramma]KAJ7649074.1 hypothetical protein DFH06DRAFT_1135328 [Mycena polygramma]